jgi:hypothetical protein
MPISRPRLALPLVLFAALALMLTAIAPVLAAPSGAAGSRVALTDHIDPADCDVVTVVEGVISVGGVALTEAQLLLLDAEVLAALALAAAADGEAAADVCVDVVIGEGDLITVNADIALCPATVEVDGEGNITLDGVEVDLDLLGVDLTNLLEAAALADVEACLFVTVEDNDVFVDVVVDACVTATLEDDGAVIIELGGVPIDLPAGAIVNLDGELEVGVAVEIGLSIVGSLDITGGTVTLEAEIIDIEGCGEAEPTQAPTEAPTLAPTMAPTGGAGPTDNVTPTLTITQPPTDGTTVSGQSSAQVILPVMLLLVAAGGLLLLQARARRTN